MKEVFLLDGSSKSEMLPRYCQKMSKRHLINIAFSLELAFFHVVLSSLHSKFSHFQELKANDFRVRMKRNAQGQLKQKTVAFEALGRSFQLSLKPGNPILSKDFVLEVIHDNGSESQVDFDMDDIYYGSLVGENNSWVSAAQHSGVWMASIISHSDRYYIEPRQNHDSTASRQSMIIYRGKDVLLDESMMNVSDNNSHERSFCRVNNFDKQNVLSGSDTQGKSNTKAQKEAYKNLYSSKEKATAAKSSQTSQKIYREKGRETPYRNLHRKTRTTDRDRDTCDIFVLADYKAFSGLGQGSTSYLCKFLTIVYSEIDSIYKGTNFGGFENIRLLITRMKIFTSNLSSDYNMGRYLSLARDVDPNELLSGVCRIMELRNYCLAHLTTERNFTGGVLGLATHSSVDGDSNWSNGICAATFYESRNVGLSTLVDNGNRYLPLFTYVRVVAHEIGHNFGADHDDPNNPLCAPSSNKGGNYIMWFQSTSSKGPNISKFSPCSRKQIAKLLKIRAQTCLKPGHILKRNLCGNGIVDASEDCDAGYVGVNDPFHCCTSDCAFEENAICSPQNHPCCSNNCTIAPPSQRCNEEVVHRCAEVSYCTGTNFELCPLPRAKPNGSPCGDGGECHNGECMSFCSLQGLKYNPPIAIKTCNCDENITAMCSFCCFVVGNNEVCKSYGGRYHDGAPCLIGSCYNGICKRDITNNYSGSRNGFQYYEKEERFRDNTTIGLGFIIIITSLIVSVATMAVICPFYTKMVRCERDNTNSSSSVVDD